MEEFKDIDDPRLFWDLTKYKIRQDTISYSKRKARERKAEMVDLEKKIEKLLVLLLRAKNNPNCSFCDKSMKLPRMTNLCKVNNF